MSSSSFCEQLMYTDSMGHVTMTYSSTLTKLNATALLVAGTAMAINLAVVAKATHSEQAVSEQVVVEQVQYSGAIQMMAYRAAGRVDGLTG